VRKKVKRPSTLEERLRVIPLESAALLVTLEDPRAPLTEEIRGAFVRLRPPEGTTPEEVSAWREEVSRRARAVRVIPPPRAADVPLASTRVDAAAEKVGSFREEALSLARETGVDGVEALVLRILDEVGA